MKLSPICCGTACLLLSIAPSQSYAENGFSPALSGEILFELQDDWTVDADDASNEVNTLSTKIELGSILSLTENFSLQAGFVLEGVQDTPAGEDTEFENEGVFVEELKAVYTADNIEIFAGKYNPSFGTAWDLAPGIYGTDFAEDYELTERIGGGASYGFSADNMGEYLVTGNAFFLDTSFLSESTITKRGLTDHDDGGVSNTEDLSSFSLTLDGAGVGGIENLNAHIGYRLQEEGDADTGLTSESGFVAGMNYSFALSDSLQSGLLAEAVRINHLDGTDDDISYLTTAATLVWNEKWNVAASYTGRNKDVSGGSSVDDYMFQLSTGYSFDNGISLDVGYRNSEEEDNESDILGALLSYEYAF